MFVALPITGNPNENPDNVSDTPERKQHTRSALTLVELLVVLGILAILLVFLLPPVSRSRTAARRTQCKNNLKHIGLALHNYSDAYDSFPPAYTVDAEGNPLHSWRTLILPFIDQKPLYDTIDLSKPWNDPANAEAYKTVLRAYSCPSVGPEDLPTSHTTYQSLVTSNSFFRWSGPRQFSDVKDGASNTLMVIEVAPKHAVHWMDPRDADIRSVFGSGPEPNLDHEGGTHALLVDGSVRFISAEITPTQLRGMVSIAGNEKVDF